MRPPQNVRDGKMVKDGFVTNNARKLDTALQRPRFSSRRGKDRREQLRLEHCRPPKAAPPLSPASGQAVRKTRSNKMLCDEELPDRVSQPVLAGPDWK